MKYGDYGVCNSQMFVMMSKTLMPRKAILFFCEPVYNNGCSSCSARLLMNEFIRVNMTSNEEVYFFVNHRVTKDDVKSQHEGVTSCGIVHYISQATRFGSNTRKRTDLLLGSEVGTI
jgi:hypothetical protein